MVETSLFFNVNFYSEICFKKLVKSVIVTKNQVRLQFLSGPKFVQRRTKFKAKGPSTTSEAGQTDIYKS